MSLFMLILIFVGYAALSCLAAFTYLKVQQQIKTKKRKKRLDCLNRLELPEWQVMCPECGVRAGYRCRWANLDRSHYRRLVLFYQESVAWADDDPEFDPESEVWD